MKITAFSLSVVLQIIPPGRKDCAVVVFMLLLMVDREDESAVSWCGEVKGKLPLLLPAFILFPADPPLRPPEERLLCQEEEKPERKPPSLHTEEPGVLSSLFWWLKWLLPPPLLALLSSDDGYKEVGVWVRLSHWLEAEYGMFGSVAELGRLWFACEEALKPHDDCLSSFGCWCCWSESSLSCSCSHISWMADSEANWTVKGMPLMVGLLSSAVLACTASSMLE